MGVGDLLEVRIAAMREREHPPYSSAAGGPGAQQHRIPRELHEEAVDEEIGSDDLPGVGPGGSLHSETNPIGLQRGPNSMRACDLLPVQGGHDRPAMGGISDQPLLRKFVQGESHRPAGCVELGGDLNLVELASRREGPLRDRIPQALGHLPFQRHSGDGLQLSFHVDFHWPRPAGKEFVSNNSADCHQLTVRAMYRVPHDSVNGSYRVAPTSR